MRATRDAGHLARHHVGLGNRPVGKPSRWGPSWIPEKSLKKILNIFNISQKNIYTNFVFFYVVFNGGICAAITVTRADGAFPAAKRMVEVGWAESLYGWVSPMRLERIPCFRKTLSILINLCHAQE